MAQGGLRVVLEFDHGEPLSGRIVVASEPAQRFRGWLELASKLERVRSAHGAGQIGLDAAAEADSLDNLNRERPAKSPQ
ncbi:MAG: hypothetical protein ABSD82_12880 [Solirubrobacteraceae bacterium]|jgi:hypothetical protein